MLNIPIAITDAEFQEIAASPELQDIWGAEDAEEMAEFLKDDYIAKFNFTSLDPMYQGDLFVIQANVLQNEIPAIRLHRGREGKLILLRDTF